MSYEVRSAPLHYEDILSKKDLEVDKAPAHFLAKGQGPTFRDIDNLLLAPIQANEDLTLKQKLMYIRRLFSENYDYSLKVENPQDRDPLANFLFHEKAGYCDFFAQAGAHLLRGIGVPSRVAYGYAGGLYDPAQKLYTFRESDAHAWMSRSGSWFRSRIVARSAPARWSREPPSGIRKMFERCETAARLTGRRRVWRRPHSLHVYTRNPAFWSPTRMRGGDSRSSTNSPAAQPGVS